LAFHICRNFSTSIARDGVFGQGFPTISSTNATRHFPEKLYPRITQNPDDHPIDLNTDLALESGHFFLPMVSSMSDRLEWSKHSFRHSFPGVKTNAMPSTCVVFPLFGSAGIVTGKIHYDLCTIAGQ